MVYFHNCSLRAQPSSQYIVRAQQGFIWGLNESMQSCMTSTSALRRALETRAWRFKSGSYFSKKDAGTVWRTRQPSLVNGPQHLLPCPFSFLLLHSELPLTSPHPHSALASFFRENRKLLGEPHSMLFSFSHSHQTCLHLCPFLLYPTVSRRVRCLWSEWALGLDKELEDALSPRRSS